MLLNYLKLSFRLMARNPFFTFINVAGLSVAFAAFCILWQYSQSELTSDQQWKDADRIVRVWSTLRIGHNATSEYKASGVHPILSVLIENEFPDMGESLRIFYQNNFDELFLKEHDEHLFLSTYNSKGNKRSFIENRAAYVDPEFFRFFGITLEEGDESSLQRADAMAISKSTATKFFGPESPVGKVVYLNDSIPLTITGVFKDLPRSSHLEINLAISSLRIGNSIKNITHWQKCAHLYIKLNKGQDIESAAEKIDELFNRNFSDGLQRMFPGSMAHMKLQPMHEASFVSYDKDTYTKKSKYFLTTLAVLGVVILLMAWINYFIMATALAKRRLKELGARRATGATGDDIAKQFFTEVFVIFLLSGLMAVTLIQLVRQPIAMWFDFYFPAWDDFSLQFFTVPIFTLTMGVLVTVFLVMRAIRPNNVTGLLSGKLPRTTTSGPSFLSLTTFQFVCATTLIVWLVLVINQIDFILGKNLGLKKEEVIVVESPALQRSSLHDLFLTFTEELKSMNEVHELTTSTNLPGDITERGTNVGRIEFNNGLTVFGSDGGVDENFIPFYGINLLAGRNFQRDNQADYSNLIISKTAAEQLGFKSPLEAVGKQVKVERNQWSDDWVNSKIIGVMEDYLRKPLLASFPVNGSVLSFGEKLMPYYQPRKVSIRINTRNFSNTIKAIEERYHKFLPGYVFNWYFLDDHINQHYRSEKIARNQIMLFTFIAIGIACLGLLGVVSNRVVEKTKEIGIRKVLGAQLLQIAQLLLNTTLRQVLMATVIGIPMAYYLSKQYLEKFSERIELQWWHFALPVLTLILIMFGTIATVVWKAARSNPVDALKQE